MRISHAICLFSSFEFCVPIFVCIQMDFLDMWWSAGATISELWLSYPSKLIMSQLTVTVLFQRYIRNMKTFEGLACQVGRYSLSLSEGSKVKSPKKLIVSTKSEKSDQNRDSCGLKLSVSTRQPLKEFTLLRPRHFPDEVICGGGTNNDQEEPQNPVENGLNGLLSNLLPRVCASKFFFKNQKFQNQ